MQPFMYTTCMTRVIWAKLIQFEVQAQKQNMKNCNADHIQGMHRVLLRYAHIEEQNW